METTQSQGITARQCVAVIADNRANRKRADEAERKLATVQHENAELKARIARLEARHRKLYRKSVNLKHECRKEHEISLHHLYRVDELEYENSLRAERIRLLMPWRWDLWQHVVNYANLCLGRFHVDVS